MQKKTRNEENLICSIVEDNENQILVVLIFNSIFCNLYKSINKKIPYFDLEQMF